ncbi:MAG: asparagine synthase C-terminal domain-containing protein [Magnetococcus sp. THC-1_WYH]
MLTLVIYEAMRDAMQRGFKDKLSMAHSLENRVPFMDNDLVDFAMQCPVGLKLNNLAEVLKINENELGDKQGQFFQKTNDGKQILRDMMSRYIPAGITRAEKQGFSSPDASWFKGESIEFVKRTLLNGNAHIYDVSDRSAVKHLVAQHLDKQQNRRLLIWSLLNVKAWIGCNFRWTFRYRIRGRGSSYQTDSP